MDLSINTGKRGNISDLPRNRLEEILDQLDVDDVLTHEELIRIGQELYENDRNTMDKANLDRMLYMLRERKPVKLREVQNVFIDYATRARDGKVGGRQKRKTMRKKVRKSRKSRRV